jgi:cytidylate kinase
MSRLVVTIDGPAASGKSTVARLLAERLGATFLDTGAMYRAVTLAAMHKGIDLADEKQLVGVIDKTKFRFTAATEGMRAYIGDADITNEIRAPEVTANARYVASCAAARKRLVEMQRRFAEKYEKIVTEGRDQGTVAFPGADVKFFLNASLDERARRRQAELITQGAEQSTEDIRRAIKKRDNSDQNRSAGPLKPADDAIIVDTTDLTVEGVVSKLLACVKEKCPEKH